MLIILPFLTFLATLGYVQGRADSSGRPLSKWRGSVLTSAAICGGLIVLISEGLSLFHSLNQPWVAALWLLAAGLISGLGWRSGHVTNTVRFIRKTRLNIGRVEGILLAAMLLIVAMLLLLAWVSPPNNVDSLRYHMSRILHWSQNQGLQHYPSGTHAQLAFPIWAETAILNLRTLWGSDRPANLIQWMSMVGSLIGVSELARLLGAPRRGQLVAAAAALSVPMGILQATSTQNDYVVAFWAVCLAYYLILDQKQGLPTLERVTFGMVLGLGMLSKGTFYVYAIPFVLWSIFLMARRVGRRQALTEWIALAAIAAALNVGFWARNTVTYGAPFGSPELVGENFRFTFPTRERSSAVNAGGSNGSQGGTGSEGEAPSPGLGAWLGQAAKGFVTRGSRVVVLNLVTPSSALSSIRLNFVEATSDWFGSNLLDFIKIQAWNHEDTAGNPLHLTLVPLSLIGLFVVRRKPGAQLALQFALLALIGYLMLPLIFRVGASLDGLRFQLPFFVLWAPIVGYLVSQINAAWFSYLVAGAFLLSAVPFLLLNNTRPIVGMPPWPTRIRSVFVSSQADVLFAFNPRIQDSYLSLAEELQSSGCSRLGLRIDSHDLEYPYWWILDAPQSGVQIETIYPLPSLAGYVDSGYEPCAILCTICGGRPRLHGLIRMGDFGNVALYAGPGFVPDEDG